MKQRQAAAAVLGAASLSLLAVGNVTAHVVQHAGPYHLEIGWQREPTYVGEANGVQVILTDARDRPVNDLKEDDLKVVVATAGQQSGELTFEPAFDLEENEGNFGEYDAPIMPTAPGDYTFHITGSIRGQKVDITVKSGDTTFDSVKGTSDIEFPSKLPTVPEIVTRLDRIDARLASQAPTGPTQASVDAAAASAAEARASADRALLVGGGIGLLGLVVAALALLIALRATRPARRAP